MRRILQGQGAEVIHLGHNRSVAELVEAAVHEDAHAVAVSSYQGGHVEYFTYLVDLLGERGAGHVRVYGGGGGVITPEEIALLHGRGVARIFSPEDGAALGLAAMVNTIIRDCDAPPLSVGPAVSLEAVVTGDTAAVARAITAIEAGAMGTADLEHIRQRAITATAPVLGITGTGGSGKSSLTDELIRRVRLDQSDKIRVAVIAVDPTRRRTGGALLGDRIRMNALGEPAVFFRSLATRTTTGEVPAYLDDVVDLCKAAGFDLVIVETPGIGQGDAGIIGHVDVSMYVMTPEFGAASQLEKIDMLDLADVVVINKADRRGGEDALRDVRRQFVRNRDLHGIETESLPVFATIASRFADDGVSALYGYLREVLAGHGLRVGPGQLPEVGGRQSTGATHIVPPSRVRYLSEVAEAVRSHHTTTNRLAALVRTAQQLEASLIHLESIDADPGDLPKVAAATRAEVPADAQRMIDTWPEVARTYREADVVGGATVETLSGTVIPRVATPTFADDGDLVTFLRSENLPGRFPFTAGVFPFKRTDEEPTRMFAGEGDAFRTNRRFHLLSADQPATRLSTAFDSVTLYGCDPAERPDIYGKIGNAGVSICTLDDMKALYDGFDLCDPATSVSMTINGPAPAVLAMFLTTVIDQQLERFAIEHGRGATDVEAAGIRATALRAVRGTVQADVLKEDQGQNTCILSTEFALRMMADVQEWFAANEMSNFYSVSISGYHIAEAGANPITQLAFTLANGFTYVEAYLARGMDIDEFAPNLSFFFSNGMDPEYTVLGRVARRIWAIAMAERYGASERSQRLKYHVQTSGRSLHAQEMALNDIRTTLQALIAIYDHCNSLHTNAFDEAVTTPTEESVQRALAIQMIINREWGLARNENPNQGSFIVSELTDLVEAAVLTEFDRLTERGGVLGAMELGYQRGRIQDESMLYEQRKHDGSLPIVGVNTMVRPGSSDPSSVRPDLTLARSTDAEKRSQLERLAAFGAVHAAERGEVLARLQQVATSGGNTFAVLMEAVRCCSLGEITDALYEVGGRYRRTM